MESPETTEKLLAEGRRLFEAGDKPRALAYFVMATNLAPDNESAWLLRAKATDDPKEAVECLEHALAINPENAQAREELVFVRVNKLQEKAREETDASRPARQQSQGIAALRRPLAQNSTAQAILVFLVIVFCGLFSLVLVTGATFSRSLFDSGALAFDAPRATPTSTIFSLPSTWTPLPTRPPTRTPTAIPIPTGRVRTDLNVRTGPGSDFQRLGVVQQDSTVPIVGRSADSHYLVIQYPDESKLAWVAADYVEVDNLAAIPVVTPWPATRLPTSRPKPSPTTTPTEVPVQVEFALGRSVEFIANCDLPWKILGTVYSSQTGAQRLNGLLVRVWAFGQLQGTVSTGSINYLMPGYWEWSFSRGTDVQGQVALVNWDGSLRSAPISFRLTSRCDGEGAVNQIILDFVGVR